MPTLSLSGCQLTAAHLPARPADGAPARYDLVANVAHEGPAAGGAFKAHVHRRSEGAWYEAEGLRVVEVLPQVVALSEAYLQIYERQAAPAEAAP